VNLALLEIGEAGTPALPPVHTRRVRSIREDREVIHGVKVQRPLKEDLAAEIAGVLGLPQPPVSRGSSVDSTFLDRLYAGIAGGPSGAEDAYRKCELLMERLGLTYDPYWDTSEASPTGGSTVTTRAYSRIRTAVTGTPRCFLINVNDAPVGTRWERDHTSVYRYDQTVTGRSPLNDAGPGARVVYYSTGKSRTNPKHFVACAEVEYIAPGWGGPRWEARLQDYTEFPTPVPVADFEMPGWNRQHAITEIARETFEALLAAGHVSANSAAAQTIEIAEPEQTVEDPGGDVVAERVIQDFPIEDADPSITIPDTLPTIVPASMPATTPTYEVTEGKVTAHGADTVPPQSRNRRRDKLAEERAVALTIKALEKAGWTYAKDCQQDGTGYDLEFSRAGQNLHVEVKGIQGSNLAFNVTPKEFWRAETDPEWVVVAVTSVLSPANFKLHLITRDRVVAASRVITGFRLRL